MKKYEKFIAVLERIKKQEKYDTTGETLHRFLAIAENIDYSDWTIDNLSEVAKEVEIKLDDDEVNLQKILQNN